MDKKVILFDLDGTIIDSTDAIIKCFLHAFEQNGTKFNSTIDEIKGQIGYPLDVMFSHFGVKEDVVWDYVDSYKNQYKEISVEMTTLLENAKSSVEEASKFARLGVVTTKTTKYTIPILENFGILDYFEIVIGRQEVEHPKPHPEPILKALEGMNLSPSKEIYMIGDTKLDIIAANESNVNNVAVLSGSGTYEELRNYTPNVVKDALEAVKLIEKGHL